MQAGYLSSYFSGVAGKILSPVEADYARSNQHEFNGVTALKRLLGESKEKSKFPAKFVYLCDSDDEPVTADAFVTWYDARLDHPVRSEYRLYFPTTEASCCAAEGDTLIIGRLTDGTLLIVIAEAQSTISNQLLWLFGLPKKDGGQFTVRSDLENDQDRIAYASTVILEEIGISVKQPEVIPLDLMLQRFGPRFPTTREFSEFARSTVPEVNPKDGADQAIISWIEREEVLFRTLEKHLLADRLSKGFHSPPDAVDVDGFLSFSLSVQNRRKSRVGAALEHHLEYIFKTLQIPYSKLNRTEKGGRPDFLFPGNDFYNNTAYPAEKLAMLGVKSTCKDRWRQVLSEADRIWQKHLFTLETAITNSQTSEMRAQKLTLVLPASLHGTFTPAQASELMNLEDFCSYVEALGNHGLCC